MPAWTLPAMALAFAFADRFAGGPYVTNLRAAGLTAILRWPPWAHGAAAAILNVRPVVWATIPLAALLAIIGPSTRYGPPLSILSLGFAGWRWTGWTTFGGDMDPKSEAQTIGLFERHTLAVPAFLLPMLFLQHWDAWAGAGSILVLVIFACFATLLGVALAAFERPTFDVNSVIEPARGFALGGLLAIILV